MKMHRLTVCIAVMSVILMFLTGCENSEEAARKTADEFLSAYQSFDFDTAEKLTEKTNSNMLKSQSDIEANNDMMKSIFDKMTYTIDGVEDVVASGATVKATITAVDMNAVMKSYMDVILPIALTEAVKDPALKKSDQEMWQLGMNTMLEMVQQEEGRVTNEVSMQVKKINGSWKVVLDDELKNSLYGGLLTATEQYNNSEQSKGD